MKIESLTLSNFKCFGANPTRLEIETGVTAFVGNNGAGKTAAFMALARLFGTTTQFKTLRKSDFHVPLDQAALPSGSTLSIDCVLIFPELEAQEQGNVGAVPEVFWHMAASGENEPLKIRMRLQATWVDDGTPEGVIEDSFRWIQSLGVDYEWESCQHVQNVERSFIQFVYVPASRAAADQVTSLLKGRLWRAARWSDALATKAAQSSEDIQNDFEDAAPSRFILERIEKRWSQVYRGDTDRQPKLRLIESTLSELMRKAEFLFYPDEAGQSRRLEDLSDGQQSLFHIALTTATLEIERDALLQAAETGPFDQERLKRTYLTILAIEEPENSLSPFFLSRIMTQAREIGALENAQVMISSHSASILGRIEPEEVRYVRMNNDIRCSSIRELTLPAVQTDARQYIRLAVKAYPELYFARFVILAEGVSESIVLPQLAEAMSFPLDRSFVPIVPLGGRYVGHFWRLLKDLEIPYATLLDLDVGRQHGGAKLIAGTVQELKAIGNHLGQNSMVIDQEIAVDEVDEIDDEELIELDQEHPWLKALRYENVYFSSPIDIDFAMIYCFPDAYKRPRTGGRGPRNDAAAIRNKKEVTLKTGGDPALYGTIWDDNFIWYPYLFLSESKPEAHLEALTHIPIADLNRNAPVELRELINKVKRVIGE